MKNKLVFILVFAAVLFSQNSAEAQKISISYNGEPVTAKKDTCAQMTLFTAKYHDGKTYLHWNVKDQQCDGIYVLLRSFDGKNYSMFGKKEGVGVPISVPIAYYFQDEDPQEGITYYKVIHVSENKDYLSSDAIKILIEGHSELTAIR